jgi:hypothetical protein
MSAGLRRPTVAAFTAMMILAAWACSGSGGGDATGTGGDTEVATVIVSGAPAGPAMVGETINLVATATNASGGVISGPAVTWKSSVPAVASVSSSGVVKALSNGQTTITATVGGRDGSATLDVADGSTVNVQGGVVIAAGGKVKLAVPAGGVAGPTLVLVSAVSDPLSDPRVCPGTTFEIGPAGSTMRGTLTIGFDVSAIPSGIAEESLQLYTLSGNAWVVVAGSTVDLTNKTVSGAMYGTGTYAVRSTPVERINVVGGSVGGALFVGQSSQLSATLFDASNQALPSRPITWTSSDPAKVAVDGTGKVTAIASGDVTITASTDGQSATAAITILARVTADWSRASDWTTYQGDSRHSGYLDATLDAAAFKDKWSRTVAANGVTNAPTVGGGQLYVTTNYYFNGQTLFALNPATGAQRWQRDFGPIFGLNQPTYYGGSVYVTTGGHEDTYLYSLSATDGSLNYQTAFDSQWEHWKAPVIAGGYVVTAGGYYGGMYGFNIATGAQSFFDSGDQVDGWGPVALNSTVYRTGSSGLLAVDAATGGVVGTLSDARLNAVITPVVGDANDLFAIIGNRLMAIDLGSMQVKWDQSGTYVGMPVVGQGTVYGFSGSVVAARRESDGTLLWTWAPGAPYTSVQPGGTQSIALTDNLLFVSLGAASYGSSGTTFAIDLASHLTVWSYPMGGDIALSSQGYLYISQGGAVAAIAVK